MYEGIIHLAIYCHELQLGCTCKGRSQISRMAEPIALEFGTAMGPVSRVACKSQLGSTLHARTCIVTVPDLKNGWADCVRIWSTDRDRLVGSVGSQSVSWSECKSVGSTPTQFRTCRAEPLAGSFVATKGVLLVFTEQKVYHSTQLDKRITMVNDFSSAAAFGGDMHQKPKPDIKVIVIDH